MDQYHEILDKLKRSKVQSFYVNDVEQHDTLLYFDVTLTTDKGKFSGRADFDNRFDGNFVVLFRPVFGELLKDEMIKRAIMLLEDTEEHDIEYSKSDFFSEY